MAITIDYLRVIEWVLVRSPILTEETEAKVNR